MNFGNVVKGTNTYPCAFNTVCKVAACGEYSYDGKDCRVTSVNLPNFIAVKNTNWISQYIAIGY